MVKHRETKVKIEIATDFINPPLECHMVRTHGDKFNLEELFLFFNLILVRKSIRFPN
jgi:hypothetical protein